MQPVRRSKTYVLKVSQEEWADIEYMAVKEHRTIADLIREALRRYGQEFRARKANLQPLRATTADTYETRGEIQ